MHITNTRKKIEKVARFIADYDGFEDYNIIVVMSPPNIRCASRFNNEQIQLQKICDTVCDYFDIDYAVVFMKNRQQPLCFIRQIIWYFASSIYKLQGTRIAAFTGFDHATVLHGVKVIKDQMQVNRKVLDQIEEIRKLLK